MEKNWKGISPKTFEEWAREDERREGEQFTEFASYLKQNNYIPRIAFFQKKEKTQAQTYLDWQYPKGKRKEITKLNIGGRNLSGSLSLEGFVNLELLYCSDNQLTNLDCSDSINLQRLWCSNNQLSNLNFLNNLNPEKLTGIDINYNNVFGDLAPLWKFINLERLCLNNNLLYGSLEPLQRMAKLRFLHIIGNDIDSGLEYLPECIENLYCSSDKRENAKVKAIYNLLANEQGIIKTNEYGLIKNFSQKLQDYKKWRDLNFTEEEIKQWMTGGFMLNDYETANQFKQKGCQLNIPVEEIIKKESWQNIHSDFNYQLRKKWEQSGFAAEQAKEWVNAGAKLDDAGFVSWLRDIKKYEPGWVANYKEDHQILSERFKNYGLCSECNQPNTGEQWCQACNSKRLKEEFAQWTSNNPKINEFIQKYQLEATDADKFLEWIPYKQFINIEHIADGGFGKVYKAKWTVGNIHHWDIENKQWNREKDHYYDKKGKSKLDFERNKDKYKKYKNYREVVLKILTKSQGNTDFLQETANHKLIDDWFNNIVPCYGLSQDPKTGSYLMVMQYMPEGNLRQYLSNKNKELSLKDKLSQLFRIAQGLKDLHQKNLIHRDLHSGNILKGIKQTECLITDLGLCKPANETSKEDKIYGVLPYVAPEVLSSRPYTQAADIYSFGVIAYEMLSGLPPYYDKKHDQYLGLAVCQGLRPQFQIKIPPLLEELINRCWDANLAKRPTANELERILRKWQANTEFKKQLKEAEARNKNLPNEIKYPDYKKKMHKGAVYHSKLLPTKEITRLLQDSKQMDLEIPAELDQQLIQSWTNHHFTPTQAQEWINTNPPAQQNQALQEPAFYVWLRDTKNLTPEQVLNHSDLNVLRQEYQTTQQQAQILQKTN